MILSIEHSELNAILDSLTEKLRYLVKDSYMHYCICSAIDNVREAVKYMKKYENQINATCNSVAIK